ncbi:hypothetical protein EG68_11081 [Paragonimus skrjabini miyazakii]|uniref:Uncharacterized protein n=1 Tax=Paragonimus skrjabini miyazakii TaxID=59628 RepID=A0A8S9YF54_9TREM|nr:hypothetical protein EG68_11081 [Paragonimus skrjabini miyazakii]
MSKVTVILGLLVLFTSALVQNEAAPKTVTSSFTGLLYRGDTKIKTYKYLKKAVREQIQKDLCEQLTNAIPWYATQRSTATCVITIKRGVTVNYTIFATDDFLMAHDPLCTTYNALLTTLVMNIQPTRKSYHMKLLGVTSDGPGHPAHPSPSKPEVITLRIDGALWNFGMRVKWNSSFKKPDDSARIYDEVKCNVKEVLKRYMHWGCGSEKYIEDKLLRIYRDPQHRNWTRTEIKLRINGNLFLESLIDYTCPSFSELIKTWLESPSAHVTSMYIWKPLKKPAIKISQDTHRARTPGVIGHR